MVIKAYGGGIVEDNVGIGEKFLYVFFVDGKVVLVEICRNSFDFFMYVWINFFDFFK